MKTLIISDLHGENPRKFLKKEIKSSKIEKLVCLGDYDTPEVLREIRGIKIPQILIVGNHDIHYVWELPISSPLMRKKWEDYANDWGKNPEERKFVRNAANGDIKDSGFLVEDRIGKKKIIYCHASITDMGSPDSDVHGYVWQRMRSENYAATNFEEMIKNDYWLMFRGHDHFSVVLSIDKNMKIENAIGKSVKFEGSKRYIISVPAYYEREYALFDSKTKTIHFKHADC